MTFLLANWRIILLVGLLAGAFGSGWTINQWRHDAESAAEATAAEAAFHLAIERINGISAKLQTTTDELDKKRMKTTKEIFNETTKIEYRCNLPESGRLLYNQAVNPTAPGQP
jgi:hypothetical protein